ncbi:MAG TPA: hypothetical protein VFA12_10360 [Stellaceae bacterium]|nr:hypothetical protein [Stellaceae bacterium]
MDHDLRDEAPGAAAGESQADDRAGPERRSGEADCEQRRVAAPPFEQPQRHRGQCAQHGQQRQGLINVGEGGIVDHAGKPLGEQKKHTGDRRSRAGGRDEGARQMLFFEPLDCGDSACRHLL